MCNCAVNMVPPEVSCLVGVQIDRSRAHESHLGTFTKGSLWGLGRLLTKETKAEEAKSRAS